MTLRAARLLLAAALLAGFQAAIAADPRVMTVQGPVRGADDRGVLVFRGVPYAAPPVGLLRWRPPQPPAPWKEVRDATRFAVDCPGAFPDGTRMAEDCLYLNVWTPGVGGRRPVMVWIYGGGFRGGSAAAPSFDGKALARAGVVLVSFGYRTGTLGFLATPELSAESPAHVSGNYGILDAIAALRWVKANIARFGGDPARVTVFGQSSGSETVSILTASPLAKGLFQRAIGESGSSLGVRRARPLARAQETGQAFMSDRGAANLAALRALPADRLIARDGETFEPTIDGWLLPDDLHAIYAAGRQNDVPMLVGSTAQEFPRPAPVSADALRADLVRSYGPDADAIAAQLRREQPTDARWTLTNREWGDFPAATWSALQAATGRAPVYRYLFDYAPPAPAGSPRIARHGAEIGYVFGTYRTADVPAVSAVDDRLHALVSRYWINFARSGDPNGPGLPPWRPVAAAPDSYLRFSSDGAAQVPARDTALIAALRQHHYGAPLGAAPTPGK